MSKGPHTTGEDCFDFPAFFAAAFSFGISISASLIYFIWRLPLTSPVSLILGLLGMVLFILFSPFCFERTRIWADCYALRLFLCLLTVLGLGYLAYVFSLFVLVRGILTIIGAISLLVSVKRALRFESKWTLVSFWFFVMGFVFGIFSTLTYFSSTHSSPFALETFQNGYLPVIDTLFHTAVTQMMVNYGVPSIGLKGVQFLNYHFGIHALFGWTAAFFGTSIVIVFALMMPMVIIPLAFGSLLRCSLWMQRFLDKKDLNSFLITGILVCITNVGVFPQILKDWAGIWQSEYVSQSAALSVLLAFLSLEIWAAWSCKVSESWFNKLVLFCGGLFFMVLCSFAKGSVGLVMIAGMFFLLVRHRHHLPSAFKSITGGALTGFLLSSILISGGRGFDISPFHFVNVYIKTGIILFFILFFFWSYCAVFVLWKLHVSKNRIDPAPRIIWETLIVVSAISALPGLILAIPGGGAYYFLFIAALFGTCIFSGVTPILLRNIKHVHIWRSPIPIACVLLAFCLSYQITVKYFSARKIYRTELNQINNPSNGSKILSILAQLKEIPESFRSSTLVYIPRDRRDFWDMASCNVVPFILPAYTGYAWLDGRPTTECVNAKYYGYQDYIQREPSQSDNINDLCSMIPNPKFRYVAALKFNNEWIIHDCMKSSQKIIK